MPQTTNNHRKHKVCFKIFQGLKSARFSFCNMPERKTKKPSGIYGGLNEKTFTSYRLRRGRAFNGVLVRRMRFKRQRPRPERRQPADGTTRKPFHPFRPFGARRAHRPRAAHRPLAAHRPRRAHRPRAAHRPRRAYRPRRAGNPRRRCGA